MAVKLTDIAKKAGVSVTTVSFVLNGKNRVSEEIKEKVFKIVKELDYCPNKTAQRLKGRKFNEICLIISGPNYEYFSNPYLFKIVQGVALVLNAHNYTLTIKTTTSNKEEHFIKSEINSNLFDGFLLWGTRSPIEIFDTFFSYKTPIVSIARASDHSYSVAIDDFKGGFLITDYLLKKGYKNIAFLGKLNHISSAKARLEGYLKALKDNNRPINENLIFEADFYQEDGYKITKSLLKDYKGKFDSIFAASDLMAIGCLKALKEKNVVVPDEMAVVGFDNIEYSDLIYKPLTTVNTPIVSLARKATEKLLDLIDGKSVAKSDILDIDIIVRESA